METTQPPREVRFRRYPNQLIPTVPLKQNNVFVISDGAPILIQNSADLREFFRKNVRAKDEEASRRNIVTVYVQLLRELNDDGSFELKEPAVTIDGNVLHGVIRVEDRNRDSGELRVTVEFEQAESRVFDSTANSTAVLDRDR